jgi:hypothetical protein
MNSVAIYEDHDVVIAPRKTKHSINAEIEAALIEFKNDGELKRRLRSIDDDTAKSGKYAGDTWLAVCRLKELTKDKAAYSALNSENTTESRIRNGLYGAVLPRLGLHRTQVIDAWAYKQRLAAREAEKEDVDHSGE